MKDLRKNSKLKDKGLKDIMQSKGRVQPQTKGFSSLKRNGRGRQIKGGELRAGLSPLAQPRGFEGKVGGGNLLGSNKKVKSVIFENITAGPKFQIRAAFDCKCLNLY